MSFSRFAAPAPPSPLLRNRLRILPAVQQALNENRPVVALESTIVAHGMPYPENVDLCRRLADILRERGVEPATIALRDGDCRIGLTPEEIDDLARPASSTNDNAETEPHKKQQKAVKCSTRDLARVLSAQDRSTQQSARSTVPPWGATTVASTMVLAHAAGIPTFVTGGIGGVHRNGHVSMDISADLVELGRTPVVVVSAGIKSILDIARTLEMLETQGVPVVAYRADEMPAFFSPKSGVPAPGRVDSAEEVADAYWTARDLGLNHGMLVAVPNHDPAGANVEAAIQAALTEADERMIQGPAVTPFLLKRVAETTAGDSLMSNVTLVQRNAEIGAEIAIAIANEQKRRRENMQAAVPDALDKVNMCTNRASETRASDSRVVVLGGTVLDVVAKPTQGPLLLGTSNPASCTETDGGVGRNISEVLGRLGHRPMLFSVVGSDSRGQTLIEGLQEDCGVNADNVKIVEGAHTATYVAILDEEGDLHTACADMSVLSGILPPPDEVLKQARALVMDANPPIPVLRHAARSASDDGVPVYLDPTSVPKARQVAQDNVLMSSLTCIFPNADELQAMAFEWEENSIEKREDSGASGSSHSSGDLEEQTAAVLARMKSDGEAQVVVSLGEDGVFLACRDEHGACSFERAAAEVAQARVDNATGAGDSLCGAYIHALLNGKTPIEAVRIGMKAAVLSLSSSRAISGRLSSSDRLL